MKVVIVSDTHRKNQSFFRVVEAEQPDMVIHCGDSEGSEYALTEGVSCPVHLVMGNCDSYSMGLPKEMMVEIGPYMAWVVHGHTYCANLGSRVLKAMAAEKGADIVFYGHTHIPEIELGGDVIAVNPGSLSYPRQAGRVPSYCVMTLNEQQEAGFEIKYIEEKE